MIPLMTHQPRLEWIRLIDDEWDSFRELYDKFEWQLPDSFNMADYLCDRWADESRVAIYTEDAEGNERTYSFAELRDITNQLANFLRGRGIERGNRVAVITPQRPETLFSLIAIWKLGAVAIPISTLTGSGGMKSILTDSSVSASLVDESNLDTFRTVKSDVETNETTMTVDAAEREPDEYGFWGAIGENSSELSTADTSPDDDAVIFYTSGTTGDPKGCLHGHKLLLGNLPQFQTNICNLELHDDDVFWTPSEWAWIGTLFSIVIPPLFFGKPVLAYNGNEFDAHTAFELLEKYGITAPFIATAALKRMSKVEDPNEQYDLSSVRNLVGGGQAFGQSLKGWASEVFDTQVHTGYGQTEAHFFVGDCSKLVDPKGGTIGLPQPGHEVAIVDQETAEPIGTAETGEIAIKWKGDPTCLKRYLNKPEKTEEIRAGEWQLTGDLGRLDEDNFITFLDRADDVMNISGYRVGPAEIEDTMSGHEAVADVGVVGVPDEERGEIPKAYVVLVDGFEASDKLKTELQRIIKDKLAMYKYPREIEFRDTIPTTVTGRVQRVKLRELE